MTLPDTMAAVLLTGHGGHEMLEYRTDVPVPRPGPSEVLVRVRACGLNNTDINTRTGWYSSSVRDGVTTDGASGGFGAVESGGWGAPLPFPLIQGADVCGYAVATGTAVQRDDLLGRRVLIDPWVLADDPDDLAGARYFGSELNGGFAQYCVAPARNVHPINSGLSDAELATFACSSSTAENLMTSAHVERGQTVVITGASGGVGTAAIQLARARGASVIAIANASKTEELIKLGASAVVARDSNDLANAVRTAALGSRIDAIVDVVGGTMFEQLLPLLRPGGSYATSGAISGPIVELDLRLLIYGDLRFSGATVCPPGTFAKVVQQIESGALRPVLAAVYPLTDLVTAQKAFVAKQHVGNIVVEVPQTGLEAKVQ
jgi:NADPH:quinone reductase-like Zn-dependent oxidoreductase